MCPFLSSWALRSMRLTVDPYTTLLAVPHPYADLSTPYHYSPRFRRPRDTGHFLVE